MTGITFNPTANNWNVLIDRPTGEVLHGTATAPHVAMQILERALESGTRRESHLTMRVRAMRRFFGTAAAVGLDTQADVAMRAAIGEFFGCHLNSRSELTAAEWVTARLAVLDGILTW
jgi:hypothetical protein